MEYSPQYLAILILSYTTGVITDEETAILDQWLLEPETANQINSDISDPRAFWQYIKMSDRERGEKMWQEIVDDYPEIFEKDIARRALPSVGSLFLAECKKRDDNVYDHKSE